MRTRRHDCRNHVVTAAPAPVAPAPAAPAAGRFPPPQPHHGPLPPPPAIV